MYRQPYRKSKLVYGNGINDADYQVYITGYVYENGNRKRKSLWQCPFYKKWQHMLERCYSDKRKVRFPNSVSQCCDDWLYFSKFKSWMEQQDWEGKHLDKDLLITGNRLYSPQTCCFIPPEINSFITDSLAKRGEYPVGVSWVKRDKIFTAQCQNGDEGIKFLGHYDCPDEAHRAWLLYKRERAKKLAETLIDPVAAQALSKRYDVEKWVE
jgi:hypothetical protein